MNDLVRLKARRRQDTSINLPGVLSATAWAAPEDLTEADWRLVGDKFSQMETGVQWWIGDWWNAFRPQWGSRHSFFEDNEHWPGYPTVRRCSATSSAFDIDRRRSALTWKHHAEVASEPDIEKREALLDWCEATAVEGGKPRSTRELRGEMWRRRRMEDGVDVAGATTSLRDLLASGQKFGCLYVDPPWLYDNQATRSATVGAEKYEGLTVEQLCHEEPYSRIGELAAENSHLHLWTTNAFLFDAPRIFGAWGFEFRSSFVWVKTSIGIGNYWRNSHEFLLTAIRGNAKHFNDKSLRSWIECDRGKHSAKPEKVREMIEKASPGPFLELFGRREVENWVVWGNEVQSDLFSPREKEETP